MIHVYATLSMNVTSTTTVSVSAYSKDARAAIDAAIKLASGGPNVTAASLKLTDAAQKSTDAFALLINGHILTGTPPSTLGARVVRATGDALIIAGKANIAILLNETSLSLAGAASHGEISVSDVRSIVAVSPVSLLVGGGGGGGNEIPVSELSGLGGGVGVAFAVGTLLLIFGVYRYCRRSKERRLGNKLFSSRTQSPALQGEKVAESMIKNPLHVHHQKSPKSPTKSLQSSPRPSPLSIKGRTAVGSASPLSSPKKNNHNSMSPKLKHSASTEKLTPHPTDFILSSTGI